MGAIEQYASRDVKVVVVGNPANTNCLITMKNAPSIPPSNFTALTRLDQNRALSQLADKTGYPVDSINNVYIWGNHSKTQYPDVNHAYISCPKSGKVVTSLRSAVNDDYWIDNTFISTVQQRGKAIIDCCIGCQCSIGSYSRLDQWYRWTRRVDGSSV